MTTSNSEYLKNFICKVERKGQLTFDHEVHFIQNEEKMIKRRLITEREYKELLEQNRNPSLKQLQIHRECFIFDKQYFQADTYLNIEKKPTILGVESSGEVTLPPFIAVEEDVTENQAFRSLQMAALEKKE